MSLSAATEDNAAFAQVVRGQLYSDFVARQNADVVFTHFTGDVSGNDVSVF